MAVRGPNVVINELMVNPQRVYDSRGEWIELFNAGDEEANLLGWTLSDDVHDRVVLPSIDIAPGQYLVLGPRRGHVRQRWRLAAIRLRQLDRAQREERPADPARCGVRPSGTVSTGAPASRCRKAPACRCRTPTSTTTSAPTGAPRCRSCAAATSAAPAPRTAALRRPQHLVITEIMQNPRLTADDRGEYFEVYNPDDQPVDMNGLHGQGRRLRQLHGDELGRRCRQGLRSLRQQADRERRLEARLLVRQRHGPAERHR